MKSVIKIDETWTVQSFRNTVQGANEILEANNLPNPSNPFAPLQSQQINQRLLSTSEDTDTYDVSSQIRTIQQNLNDRDKSFALASLDEDTWKTYEFTGMIDGYLQVPETMITERESVEEGVRQQIMNSDNLEEIRELLQPSGELDLPSSDTSSDIDSSNWFWKPTGDVMFGVEGDSPMEIPCWPESVKDSTSATWSQEMTTFQHYEPKQTYKGSGPRTVSCSFKIHRAMWTGNQDSGDCEKLIAYMESACYPDYDTQAAEPPRSLLLVGNSVRIRGIMTSFDKSYQGPIGPDNKYDEVIINISITEESDNVLSTSTVRGGLAGWR